MSTKSVADKLRIEPGAKLWTSHPDRLGLLEPLPAGVGLIDGIQDAAAAVVFGDDAVSLREVVAANADGLRGVRILWVAYPKGNRGDLNRDSLWPILAEQGLRPIGQIAIDDAWSAMRFRPLEPGEEFTGGRRS